MNAAANSSEAQAGCRSATSIGVIFGLCEALRLAGLTIARNARYSLSGRGTARIGSESA
ncbi:MAG: hypothetical protein V9E93_03405 [Steroidobacteraceae bacterium]|nr:hypothetical protein [Steroidobacteraceae bacterium]MBP7012925.1 hypothetical protein [Steroidobacteraceae bacterium]